MYNIICVVYKNLAAEYIMHDGFLTMVNYPIHDGFLSS